jgi:hypothetical protein
VLAVCQPGENLLASGYCMYSSSVIFVLSVGTGVYGFTLDPLIGEFVLTHDKIQIPKSGKIYSFNEGNYELWDDKLKRWVLVISEPETSALSESTVSFTDFPRRLETIPFCPLDGLLVFPVHRGWTRYCPRTFVSASHVTWLSRRCAKMHSIGFRLFDLQISAPLVDMSLLLQLCGLPKDARPQAVLRSLHWQSCGRLPQDHALWRHLRVPSR